MFPSSSSLSYNSNGPSKDSEPREDEKEWDMKWFDDETIETANAVATQSSSNTEDATQNPNPTVSAPAAENAELPPFIQSDEVPESRTSMPGSKPPASSTSSRQTESVMLGLDKGPAGLSSSGMLDRLLTPAAGNNMPTTSILLPQRPAFTRSMSNPAPPQQQAPPPPNQSQGQPSQQQQMQQQQQQQQQQNAQPTDSLSLMQLKRLVNDMPKYEPAAYAFVYEDAAPFPEEIEEWFGYSEEERGDLLSARAAFEKNWAAFGGVKGKETSWLEADERERKRFVERSIAGLEAGAQRRNECLEALVYVGLGVWGETAGLASETDKSDTSKGKAKVADNESEKGEDTEEKEKDKYEDAGLQQEWMTKGADLIYEALGIPAIYDVLRLACLRAWDESYNNQGSPRQQQEAKSSEARELRGALTAIYLLVEAGRRQIVEGCGTQIRDEFAELEPSYMIFLVKVLAKLRWDESPGLPVTKLALLLWKSILLLFGGTKDIIETKEYTRIEAGLSPDETSKTLITASPLDYHLFRQELTSKYPAYNPPPPLLPLELENNSILPPLPNHSSRTTGVGFGPANVSGGTGSILHQPVHIATPAPSPPPSPAGPGGKGGKKQNYQTNQNFPFLYPPLDSTSNSAGGKGGAGRQEALVGKKWEGSDIPTSILEAGDLFAKRMRMTRAMKQLWEERERYMKFERGWGSLTEDDADVEEMDLAGKIPGDVDGKEWKRRKWDTKRRLDAVEDFYRHSLPHLQSFVIVLLKVILANVTALITQPSPAAGNGLAPAFPSQDNLNGNGPNRAKGKENGRYTNGMGNQTDGNGDSPEARLPLEELDAIRTREITGKAVSGILLLILKWFKISHILKFEYMTQLLLDSNYLPLILKLFAHQEMERVVESKTDREEFRFFHFCHTHSINAPTEEEKEASSDEDEACPPPIVKLRRDPSRPASAIDLSAFSENSLQQNQNQPQQNSQHLPSTAYNPNTPFRRAAATDLADSTGDITAAPQSPLAPITTFSWRNFFASINHLRIMQKICKAKAHRNLLLVQYKSSTILKKALKVPQPQLRLYTLKLFKNQVPYCGRKWRQSNMRVITAIYLHCRPELRDDWLAGTDVEAGVEEALPLEQALRALTHWANLRRYPAEMGVGSIVGGDEDDGQRQRGLGVLAEEQDFFVRELERMDFGPEDGVGGDESEAGWDGGGGMEGW